MVLFTGDLERSKATTKVVVGVFSHLVGLFAHENFLVLIEGEDGGSGDCSFFFLSGGLQGLLDDLSVSSFALEMAEMLDGVVANDHVVRGVVGEVSKAVG